MASTYSANLRLELIGTGEQQGTWGSTTNTNLGTLLEQAIGGYESVTVSNVSDTTLTTANGSTDQARNMTLNLTGTISAARNVICPAIEKIYIVKNATTGGFAVTFKVSGQTGVSIPNGATVILYVDGTDARLVSQNPVSLSTGITGTLPVANGGTGTTTSTGSGSVVLSTSPTLTTPTINSATLVTPNLGTPSAGTLTNATGLPIVAGTTGTLSVARGGTGVTTSTGTGNVVLSASPTFSGTPLLGSAKIDAFPSGTRLLFQQTAAPTGWTKDTTQNDKALRVVSGTASTGGTTAFSSVFTSRTPSGTVSNTISTGTVGSTTVTGTVGDTALNSTQIPAHSHFVAAAATSGGTLINTNYVARTYDGTSNLDYSLKGTATAATIGLTSETGSGATHTHSLSMNSHNHTLSMNAHNHTFTGSALDFAVQYVDVIIASKD